MGNLKEWDSLESWIMVIMNKQRAHSRELKLKVANNSWQKQKPTWEESCNKTKREGKESEWESESPPDVTLTTTGYYVLICV